MAINSKHTKAQILAAYKELEKQQKTLQLELKKVAKPLENSNQTKNYVPIEQPPKILVQSGREGDMDQIIQSLAQIQNNFGGAVGYLSEKLIKEATKLETVKTEIAQEEKQLQELYQLDEITESTIDKLIEQYKADAKKFLEQIAQATETSQQEIESLKQSWHKEQEVYQRSLKTRNEEQRKTQQREQEEYEYNLDLARDLNEEAYEQEKKQRQQELAIARQTLEKQWQEQETAIAKQEQEYAEAQEQVTAFPEKLAAKIRQGKEEGKGIGIYQGKIKADLRTREIEGAAQNYQLRIESLEQTIKHQAARITKLTQQLDTSLKQVQDLAVKAIEGTSNRNSFEAMKAIAMEQAKTPLKGK